MNDVDLTQLAIDRGDSAGKKLRTRHHWLTRYLLPAALLLGVLALLAWASRDLVFPPVQVTVVPVHATQAEVARAGTPVFQAAGWIEPRPTPVRVAALAAGAVEQLLVVEDQPVSTGEPIAELVKDDASLALERAQADLKLREAQLQAAKAVQRAAITRFQHPVHLQAALQEAEASLAKTETQLRNLPFETRRAEAQLDFAQKDVTGKTTASGVVAGVEIDRANSSLESAQALVEELRQRADSLASEQAALAQRRGALKKQLDLLADETEARDAADAMFNAAAARVEQARVQLAEARLRLDRMTVRAPIDGRVYQLVSNPGTMLTPGMGSFNNVDGSTVVTMYRPDRLQVRVDVRFQDIPQVVLGQPVRIENPALTSPLIGQVLFVSSEADIQKNTLEVKVAVDSPPSVFKPEMLVDVTFIAPQEPEKTSDRALVTRFYVSQDLVRQDDSGSFVWLADQSAGVARRTDVETGAVGPNDLVEITRGLKTSNRVIATSSESLENGDRIVVIGEEP